MYFLLQHCTMERVIIITKTVSNCRTTTLKNKWNYYYRCTYIYTHCLTLKSPTNYYNILVFWPIRGMTVAITQEKCIP